MQGVSVLISFKICVSFKILGHVLNVQAKKKVYDIFIIETKKLDIRKRSNVHEYKGKRLMLGFQTIVERFKVSMVFALPKNDPDD